MKLLLAANAKVTTPHGPGTLQGRAGDTSWWVRVALTDANRDAALADPRCVFGGGTVSALFIFEEKEMKNA